MALWLYIAALALLLAASAFFSASETALFSLQRETIVDFAQSRKRRAVLVSVLMSSPRELLSAILLGNLLVNITFYAATAMTAYDLAVAERSAAAVAMGLGGLFGVIIFGDMLPKAFALTFNRQLAPLVAAPLFIAYTLLKPARYVLNPVVRALTAGFQKAVRPPERITREELSVLVDAARAQGHIPPQEGEMIEAVMVLAQTRVREIMAPRVDLVAIEAGSSADDLVALFKKTRRTKIPVYVEDLDHIVGIAMVKDALLDLPERLDQVTTPAAFVPEAKTAESLLREFQHTRTTVAIVVDEYGGTAGIVTLADVAEQIVGPISDEYEAPEQVVTEIAPGRYRLAGDLSIREWEELFNIDAENERLSTLGGFIMLLLGRIPRAGDTVNYRNVRFTVDEVRRHRIVTVTAEVVEEPTEGGTGGTGGTGNGGTGETPRPDKTGRGTREMLGENGETGKNGETGEVSEAGTGENGAGGEGAGR